MNTYTLGSLFDGSGGFPLAGSMCGITPVWAAEVEPYPIAVTRSRFPNMIHLGDVSKINGAEIPPVDIITFGSPCQDLSVAGKRAGLKHESNGDDETTRSGLFMEAVRIIKEMRNATDGRYPTFALWENVPGAFSSNKGEDFRIVLEELVKIVEPTAAIPAVDKNGWAYADCYMGDGWSLAYRVFDAQYWGVPQRRRRIHLVADFRGQRAGEILFKREGLRGYFEESRQEREEVTRDAENCVGTADCAKNCVTYDARGNGDGNIVSTITGDHNNRITDYTSIVCYGISSYTSNSMLSDNPYSGIYEAKTNHTLDLNGENPACNQGRTMVVEPIPYTLKIRSGCEGGGKGALIQNDKSATLSTLNDQYLFQPVYCLQGNGIDRADTAGCNGAGWREGAAYTLNTIDRPAVCYAETYQKVTGPLMANSHPGSYTGQDAYNDMLVVGKEKPIVLDRAFYNQGVNAQYEPQLYTDGTVPTLVAKGPAAVCTGVDCRNATEYPETTGALQASCNHNNNSNNVVRVNYIVRRLTPTECARLQGFPDMWGHPDKKDDFTDEEYRFWVDVRNTHAAINGKAVKDYTKDQMLTWYNKLHVDSSEYKMWGNGIALPPALYCMQGMVEALCE